MALRDAVERDRAAVFLSLAELADEHSVDGRAVPCVIDRVERADADLGAGVPSDASRIFARAEDMPARRRPGEQISVDGRSYVVLAWRDEMGVAEVDVTRGW